MSNPYEIPVKVAPAPQNMSTNVPVHPNWNVSSWYFCLPLECKKGDVCSVSLCHCFCAEFWLCNKVFNCNNHDHHCRACIHYSNNLGWLFAGCIGVFEGVSFSPMGICKDEHNCCGPMGLFCSKNVSRKNSDYIFRQCLGTWCVEKLERRPRRVLDGCDDCCPCFSMCNYGCGWGPFGFTNENCYPFWCDLSDGNYIIKNRIINCQILKDTAECTKGCSMGCLVCYSKSQTEINGKKFNVEKGCNYCLPWNKYEMV